MIHLGKKFELSAYLNQQCLTDRQKRTDTLLSRIDIVRSKAQKLELEQFAKKLGSLISKEEEHPVRQDQKITIIQAANEEKKRTEKLRKNLENIAQ